MMPKKPYMAKPTSSTVSPFSTSIPCCQPSSGEATAMATAIAMTIGIAIRRKPAIVSTAMKTQNTNASPCAKKASAIVNAYVSA